MNRTKHQKHRGSEESTQAMPRTKRGGTKKKRTKRSAAAEAAYSGNGWLYADDEAPGTTMTREKSTDPRCGFCNEKLFCGGVGALVTQRYCDYKTTWSGGYGYRAVYCGHCGAVFGAHATSVVQSS
jgi:hypothetical protein